MPLAGILLLTIGTCHAVLRRPLRTALATFLFVLVLVPDTMALPGPGMGYLPVVRLVLVAFAARLALDAARGNLWFADLRLTRVHGAFAAHLAVIGFVGIVLAPPSLPLQPAMVVAGQLVEQVLAFTVVLVACRAIGDARWMLRTFALVAATALSVATVERVTGASWAHWMLGGGARPGAIGAFGLEGRGGGVRVRVAAQFALAFAWVVAMLFPLLVAFAARSSRWRWKLAPALAAGVVVWTGSRSALPGLAVALVVLVVAARFERPLVAFGVMAGVAGLLALGSLPAVSRAYTAAEAAGSDQTRIDRLAAVADEVAQRPVRGLGVSSLSSVLGFYGADASYLSAYVDAGVLGVTSLVVVLVITVVAAGAALRAPPGSDDRRLGAACLAAVLMGVAGAAFHDLFSVPASNLLFWSIAAAGIATGERHRPLLIDAPRLSRARLLLPIGGVVVGVLLAVTAPRHAAVEYRFTAMPLGLEASARADVDFVGKRLATTACDHLETIGRGSGVRVRCRIYEGSGGVGEVRVEAPDATTANAFGDRLVERVAVLQPGFRAHRVGPAVTGRPTATATAPIWLGFAGALFALLFPPQVGRARDDFVHAASPVPATA